MHPVGKTVAVLTLLTSLASGGIITNSSTLPPATGQYALGTSCVSIICFVNPFLTNFVPISSQFVGGNQVALLNVDFVSTVFTNVGGSPGTLIGPVLFSGQQEITYFGRSSPTQIGTFSSQLNSVVDFDNFLGFTGQVRLSPGTQSLGQTIVAELGKGLYRIDSSFTTFTEVSINGGPFVSGPPNTLSLTPEVPEPATGLLALGGLLAVALVRRCNRLPAS